MAPAQSLNLWTAPDPMGMESGSGDGTIREFICQGLDEQGSPIYSQDKVRVVMRDAIPTYNLPWWHWDINKPGLRSFVPGGGLWLDEKDGSIFLNYGFRGPDEGINYGNITMDAKVVKYNGQGELMWRAGRKTKSFAEDGEFYMTTSISGEAKGCLFVEDMNGQVRVFDKETGLFVGDVLEDPYREHNVGPNVDNVERANASQVFTHARTGRDYLLASSLWGTRIYRITGLDDIQRASGKVVLPEEDVIVEPTELDKIGQPGPLYYYR